MGRVKYLIKYAIIQDEYNCTITFTCKLYHKQKIDFSTLIKTQPFNSNGFEAYHTSERLKLTGKVYNIDVDYLTNYYVVDDLASQNSFDTLTQYITTHRTTPFLGTPSNGLVFDVNGTLKEKNQNVYTTAGSYELKSVNGKEIILIHPTIKYAFLSRPRRFGKSLFIDILQEIFEGNKKLFKGLYIDDKWDFDDKYPVIKISFSGSRDIEALKQNIFRNMHEAQEKLGIECSEHYDYATCFSELIKKSY